MISKPIFYYINSCSTCKRILQQLGGEEKVALRDLKQQPLQLAELDALQARCGSYEALFNKRSQQIKLQGLDLSNASEAEYRTLIPQHYSFLKRPVLISESFIAVGSDAKTVENAVKYIKSH